MLCVAFHANKEIFNDTLSKTAKVSANSENVCQLRQLDTRFRHERHSLTFTHNLNDVYMNRGYIS